MEGGMDIGRGAGEKACNKFVFSFADAAVNGEISRFLRPPPIRFETEISLGGGGGRPNWGWAKTTTNGVVKHNLTTKS